MTANRSTWNKDGSPDRSDTDPDDGQPKRLGRDRSSDATVYLYPEGVEPGLGRHRQQLFTRPLQMTDGCVSVPTGPGLAVEIDRPVLEAYRA